MAVQAIPGALDRAISLLEQGLAGTPSNAAGHYALAWLYLQKGQQDKATAEFRKVIELAPAGKEAGEAGADQDQAVTPRTCGDDAGRLCGDSSPGTAHSRMTDHLNGEPNAGCNISLTRMSHCDTFHRRA